MEFTTNNPCTMHATSSDLDSVLNDPKCMMHRANGDVGTKSPYFETVLPETTVTTSKELAQLFMERIVCGNTVANANEDMTGTVVENDSDTTDYRAQPLSKVRL